MLDLTVMLALTSNSSALMAGNSCQTEKNNAETGNNNRGFLVTLFTQTYEAVLKMSALADIQQHWNPKRQNMFFTSMKLLFHSLAWILRTACPEKLWSGH